MAVIGLLLALISPAVQAAREAARAMQCLSNLRQIGLATHQYEEVHRMFPGWRQLALNRPHPPGQPPPGDHRVNDVSILAQLLPYLDQSATFEELNLSKGRVPDEQESTAAEWDMLATVIARRMAVFLCPSDSGQLSPGSNYRACMGSGPAYKFNGEFPDSGNGFFAPLYDQVGGEFPVRVRTISDGLSQTAMFSERLRGSGDVRRFHAARDATQLRSDPSTADATMARCRIQHEAALQGEWGWNPWLGRYWVLSGYAHTLYNHVMPPNAGVADCLTGADPDGPTTARSEHSNGVHVLLGDGSGRPIHNAVDLQVWRSIGTRNGGETVLVGSY